MAAGIGSYEVPATAAVYYRHECERWLKIAVAECYEEGYPIDYVERARCLGAAEDCAALSCGAEVLWGTDRRADGSPAAWRIRCLIAPPTVIRIQA